MQQSAICAACRRPLLAERSIGAMEYPTQVARHFSSPANVGPLEPGAGRVCRGEAGAAERGTWVVFEAQIDAGRIRRLAFRAYGCPYVIAACSRITELLTDTAVCSLLDFAPAALAAELDLPTEKSGSLLIIQDALRNCFRDWDTTPPAAAR